MLLPVIVDNEAIALFAVLKPFCTVVDKEATLLPVVVDNEAIELPTTVDKDATALLAELNPVDVDVDNDTTCESTAINWLTFTASVKAAPAATLTTRR